MLTWHKHPALRLVIGVAILFWVLCGALVLWRYYGFYPSYATFDQGIFNQVFWNSLHGQFFQSSLSSTESIAVSHDGQVPEVFYPRLGQHFTPSLMLWLPFYALFPSAMGLSVLQVTLVTAAGLMLYALARQYCSFSLSTMITISYYAANAVIGPTLANFHDFCQIPLYVFGILLAMEKRWWWLFGILAGLTLAVREDAGVILFSIGAYLVLSRRYPRIGGMVCILSLGYMLVLTNLVMPLFSQDISRRFMIEQFGQFVDSDEASTVQIIGAMVSHPWQLLVELFTPFDRTLRYLLAQWLPLAFVPVVSPSAWVLAGFPLLKILMSQNPSTLAIDRRYAMTLVPGLFYGAILWWSCHAEQFRLRFRRFWVFCLGLALLLTITSNPNRVLSFVIPDSFQPWVYTSPARQWQHAQVIRSFLARIPPDARVSASTYIVPHLSGRREIVRFPELQLRNDQREVVEVDYAIADLWQFQQYQSAFEDERTKLRQTNGAIARSLRRDYGLVSFQDGIALMRQGVSSDAIAEAAWKQFQQELKPVLQKQS